MGTQPDQALIDPNTTLALSLSQREVWLDQLAWPRSAHLTMGGGCFYTGVFDVQQCRQALELLVRECHTLRLVPLRAGGQRLLAHFDAPLELVEVAAQQTPEQAMQDWWDRHFERPFAFDTDPPWRFAVIRAHSGLHGLVMQFHHTIMDGWGASQVMRRWCELYNLIQAGQDPPLGEHASYLQFIDESNQYAASEAFVRDASYWREQVPQLLPPLIEPRFGPQRSNELPPAHLSVQTLARAEYQQVAQSAAQQDKTVFTLFLAALALYFSRTAERSTVLIGVPTLNRGGKRYLKTAGMFVGVSALRLEVRPDMLAGELVAAASTAMRGALRHPRYPLSELGRALGVARAGRDRLFDVLLSFELQDYAISFGAAPQSGARQFFSGIARYPLGVTVCEFHHTYDPQLWVEGSAACFTEPEVAWLGRRLWHIVQCLAADSQLRLASVSVVPPAERHALVDARHAAVRWHEAPPTYVAQFEQHAKRAPLAIALVWDGGSMDYSSLEQRANQLAHRLVAQGAGPDRVVAVAMARSPETVVAMLAIAKAGAAYLPLDPDAPLARLAVVLADSSAVALLVHDYAWERLAHLHPHTLVGTWQQALVAGADPGPPVSPRTSDLAYVIFTSGSTGRPKGVMMEHAALSHRMAWLAKVWEVTAADRTAQATQTTFDPSLIELCLPLACGASIALAPPGRLAPQTIAQFALRHAVTVMAFVPSTLGGFVDAVAGNAALRLRVACCGGEVLPPEMARRYRSQTGARLFNVYGPTEACIFATAWECGDDPPATLPIGQPVDDSTIHVLDRQMQVVPFGVCGEVYIGGLALARGYLNQPDLTAACFVDDPFVPGARLYRTGDRGWLDPHGQLHFVGRVDRQVKLRGYRVELGEVEAALLAIEGVTHAAAKLVDHGGKAAIHAWAVTSSGLQPDALQRVLRVRLPDYMVPGSITLLGDMPVSDSGKIDYEQLEVPPVRVTPVVARAPRSQIERDLLALWEEVLERRPLSVQDNFFDVGGDSLAAVSILAGAERLLGRRIPLYLLTEHPTIEQLVAALGEPLDPHALLVHFERNDAQTPFFLAASGHGDLMRMHNLARAAAGFCDLSMLQPPLKDLPARIVDLGQLYVQEILARGGRPCFVGGFSVGGIAALETARLLQAKGVQVLGLILLDTVYPKAVWGGTFYWRVFGWLVRHLRIQDLSLNGRRLGAMFNDQGLVGQVMAMRGYRAHAFAGKTYLIKTIGLTRWHGMLFRSWRTLMGSRLSEHRVAGLHGSIFESANVAGLAQELGLIFQSGLADGNN